MASRKNKNPTCEVCGLKIKKDQEGCTLYTGKVLHSACLSGLTEAEIHESIKIKKDREQERVDEEVRVKAMVDAAAEEVKDEQA